MVLFKFIQIKYFILLVMLAIFQMLGTHMRQVAIMQRFSTLPECHARPSFLFFLN